MAYISPERTREIKKQLSKEFPLFKFSVKNDNHTAIRVRIEAGPVKFVDMAHSQLNHYYPGNYEHSDILKKMIAIINQWNYDKSDIMTDYFDVGYYVTLEQGSWNKPYQWIAELNK